MQTEGADHLLAIRDEQSLDAELIRIDRPVSFGRYQLCYELGSGGMATVYLARAEGPGRFAKPVAIKRIHPHLAKRKELVGMFLDEARIASLINHPNVCTTFDFGEVGGEYYLAMEYLVGEPLNVLLRRAAMRPEILASARWQRALAKIIADVCEGLHAAHELRDEKGQPLGVVHRDVSPQNMFVTYDGVAKLVDFGVAFAADRITRTMTGGIKGKIGYLAPEQLRREGYDRRLDVWGIGVVLWEGLTGQRLFVRRSEVDTLLAVQHYEVPPPSQVVATIAASLDAPTLRALARDPAERYATARALGRDLVAYLGSSGPPLTNVEVGELFAELCGDRRDLRAGAVAQVMDTAFSGVPKGDATEPEPTLNEAVSVVSLHDGATAPSLRAIASRDPPHETEPPHGTLLESASRAAVVATKLTSIARLSVVGIAAVAVIAMGTVAYIVVGRESGDVARVVIAPPDTTSPRTLQSPPSAMLPAQALPAATPPVATVSTPSEVTPSTAPMVVTPAPPVLAPEPASTVEVATRPSASDGRARPPGRGNVAVVCPTLSVQVCVRGGRCAPTPTRFDGLPAGRTTLRFRAPDGRTWSRAVTVEADRTSRVITAPP